MSRNDIEFIKAFVGKAIAESKQVTSKKAVDPDVELAARHAMKVAFRAHRRRHASVKRMAGKDDDQNKILVVTA